MAEVNRRPGQYGETRAENDLDILRDLVDGMLIGFGEEPADKPGRSPDAWKRQGSIRG
jgi:hypothetical protein